jgi:hypothetical protein
VQVGLGDVDALDPGEHRLAPLAHNPDKVQLRKLRREAVAQHRGVKGRFGLPRKKMDKVLGRAGLV